MLTQEDWDVITRLGNGEVVEYKTADYPKIVLLAERATKLEHLTDKPCYGICFSFGHMVQLVFGE